MKRRLLEIPALIAATALLTADSCGGDVNNYKTYGDPNWNIDSLTVQRDYPQQCPYVTLDYGEEIAFQETTIAPDVIWIGLQQNVSIADQNNVNVSGGVVMATYTAFGASEAAAEVGGFFGASTVEPGPTYDTALVASQSPNTQIVSAWLAMQGDVDSSTLAIGGSDSGDAGQAVSFVANVLRDTMGYRYQWQVNGANVSGATSHTFKTSFVSAGTYTIGRTVTLTDNHSNNTSKPFHVNLDVSAAGPAYIKIGLSGSYTATGAGGTAPYTYAWYLAGTKVGTGPTYSATATMPPTAKPLRVTATDASGHHGEYDTQIAFVCANGKTSFTCT